jgi:Holliday junction resolvase RusA-like endonuclease
VPFACRQKKNSRPIFYNKKTGKPFVGKDKSLGSFEKDSSAVLKSQMWKYGRVFPIKNRICVDYYFRFEKASKADLDNLITSAQDLLQLIGIIENDKQIKRLCGHIHDESGLHDCFEIKIKILE